MKFTALITILGIAFLSSCSQRVDLAKEKQAMIDADKAFSKLSEKVGIQKSFLLTIDSSCILLRANQKPIVGNHAIITALHKGDDRNIIMTWKPLSAEIAASGDMGFTYGIYTFCLKNDSNNVRKGTYLSIWKKNRDGKWKLWVDTGNQGIGE